MINLLWGFHVLVCIVLIIVVLLQAGRGAGIGFSFGGGASQTIFGSSGGKNFFARLTSGLAIVFMTTSIVLSIFSSHSAKNYRGVMQSLPESSEPSSAEKAQVPAPAEK